MKLNKKELKVLMITGFVLVIIGVFGIIINSNEERSCVPYNVLLSKNRDNAIKISWKTRDMCLGYVLYGDSLYEIERVVINTESMGKSKEHEVVVPDLLSTSAYYFIIVSDEQPYGNKGKPIALYINDVN